MSQNVNVKKWKESMFCGFDYLVDDSFSNSCLLCTYYFKYSHIFARNISMNCKWFCCTLYLIIFFTWIWYCSHNGFFSICVYLFLFENYLHNFYYYFVFIAFLMCDCSKKITCVLTSNDQVSCAQFFFLVCPLTKNYEYTECTNTLDNNFIMNA